MAEVLVGLLNVEFTGHFYEKVDGFAAALSDDSQVVLKSSLCGLMAG